MYPGFCDEYYTEIHPPELIVVSRLVGGRTEAHVTATGAWAAEPLTFAVFPPPRPSLNAVLRHRIRSIDRNDGSALALEGFPAANPNHLVGRLTSTAGDSLYLGTTGTVLMTSRRGLKCVIECWWDDPGGSSIEFILGQLDDTPASNSHIFYRDTTIADSNWSLSPVVNTLSTTIRDLPAGDYVFRPASPDWNFGGGLAGTVPKALSIRGGSAALTFPAVPRTLPASLADWPGFSPSGSDVLPPDVVGQLRDLLLSFNISSRLGVQGNGLRYADLGGLLLNLQGWVRLGSDRPILRAEDAYMDSPLPSTFPPHILRGAVGGGVSRARVAVYLLLHSRGRTLVADRKEYQTDDSGFLNVIFRTGSHVEDISFALEVLENPFNPWFRPFAETEQFLVYPGATGNDAGPQTLPVLEPAVTAPVPSPTPAKNRAIKLTAQHADLLEEIEEKRELFDFSLSKMFATKTVPKMLPAKVNMVVPKNTKLPGKLENNWLLMKDPVKAKTVLGDKLAVPTPKKPNPQEKSQR